VRSGTQGRAVGALGLPLDPSAPADPTRPVALSATVARCTAPNPGMMTGPGTNTYLVGARRLVVVDPGPDDPAHLDRLAALGRDRIRTVVVTHTHPDHAPGAAGLAARTGAEVLGFGPGEGFVPTRSVGEGHTVAVEGATVVALHTPGHAADHLCWLLAEEATLFSGDHVMDGSTVVIAPPDGDMTRYVASLRRLRALDPPLARIAPGHGALIEDPGHAVDTLVAHRLRREALVVRALRAAGRATVDDLLPVVYADVGHDRHHVARRSLWAHLRKLGTEGRARSADPDDVEAPWSAR